MSNVLNLRSVEKSFGGLKVIDNVSFSVKKGSRTALIGPNGAGKTTIFNLLSGIYEVDNGSISLDNNDITQILYPYSSVESLNEDGYTDSD